MFTKIVDRGFSGAVHSNPDLLLVDEVLSAGDASFEDKCLVKMHDLRARGTTIVVVSHSTDLVRKFCHRVLLIEGGHLVAGGDPEETSGRYLERLTPQVEMSL